MKIATVKVVSDGRGNYNFFYKGEFLLSRYVPDHLVPFVCVGVRDLCLKVGVQVVYLLV